MQRYKDIQILCTPKGYDYFTHTKINKEIQRYTKIDKDTNIYRFYAHPKDMTTIHTQKYAKMQRYTDSMHTQRI